MIDYKTILWDFDGVILDSMAVRDWGFREIFKDYNNDQVNALISYHRANGGLSRYVKIRYFYETILGSNISDQQILSYAEKFSVLMKKELVKPKNLIEDSLQFIKSNYTKYSFHIVSGSDQEELRYLCNELNLSKYFLSIHGSPTPKITLVRDLLAKYKYNESEVCLIGDSFNDYEAAKKNFVDFLGYRNVDLQKINCEYIEVFPVK